MIDKLFYYDISNYAVPFFYACTGYFLIANQPEQELHTKLLFRCKKVMKLYLVWSAVYLPMTICGWWIEGGGLKYWIRCLRNYLSIGENFYSWTLWYLNGLIFALFLIDFLLKKLSIRQICEIGVVLYLAGIVLTLLNTHSEGLPAIIARIIHLYFSLFMTTRNGLFQSLAFVSIGMLAAQMDCAKELKISVQEGILAWGLYLAKVYLSLKKGGGTAVRNIRPSNVLVSI